LNVLGVGFVVWGLGGGVQVVGCRIQDLGQGVKDSWFSFIANQEEIYRPFAPPPHTGGFADRSIHFRGTTYLRIRCILGDI